MVLLTLPLICHTVTQCATVFAASRGYLRHCKSWSKSCTGWNTCRCCRSGKSRSYSSFAFSCQLHWPECLFWLLPKTWQHPSIRIIENSDNWDSDNRELTVLLLTIYCSCGVHCINFTLSLSLSFSLLPLPLPVIIVIAVAANKNWWGWLGKDST